MDDVRRKVKQLYERRSEIDAELARHDAAFEAQRLAREASLRPLLEKREALDEEMNDTLGDNFWIEGRFDADGLPVVNVTQRDE